MRRVLQVLLRGCLACCRLVLPVLDGTNLVLGQAGAGPVQATLVVATSGLRSYSHLVKLVTLAA